MLCLARIGLSRWLSKRRLVWAGAALAVLGLIAVVTITWVVRVPEEVAEATDETTGETPSETIVEMPAGTPKTPADTPETPTETPAEKPTETATDKPAETPVDKPTDKPTETPVAPPAEKPTETLADKPAEKPTQVPNAKPADPNLPPFDDVSLKFADPARLPVEAELRAVLAPLAKPYKLVTAENKTCRFQGLARIQGWGPDSVLRLTNVDGGNLQRLHVWGQKQGVSFCWYPRTAAIAAYRTLQEPGSQEATVAFGELLATDDGRDVRLPVRPYFLRYQDGAVILSQGNIPLLTVALEGPVQAVYFEAPGEMELRDVTVLRAGPGTADAPTTHRLVFDSARPAELPWKENLPAGARLQRMDDGSVELSADKPANMVTATVPVPGSGIYAVIFQVDNATLGSGIGLFDGADQPVTGIDYGQDRQARSAFNFGAGFDLNDDGTKPMPYAGPAQWLRLIVAGGIAKCSVSNDGVHWGKILEAPSRSGAWRSVGLYLQKENEPLSPNAKPRHIRLRRLQIRELDGLTGAVAAELLGRAAAADTAMKLNESIAAWTQRIANMAPKDCTAADWSYACTLQALAGRIPTETAQVLLHRAVNGRLANLSALPARLRLLQDAALLESRRPDQPSQHLEYWDRLGRDMLHIGVKDGFELYQKALMEASVCGAAQRHGPMSRTLIADTQLLLYAEQRWAELEKFLKETRSWGPASPELSRGSAENRSPVVIPVNKIAGSILLDVEAALNEKQYKGAARLLTNSYVPRDESLTTAPDDKDLFLSFRSALGLKSLTRPEFTEAMNAQIGPADALKIQQAMSQGDPVVVESLIVQYHGTPVASTACQWLGDRALAGNDFVQALLRYQEAGKTASPEQQPSVLARIRLVSAMLGKPAGEPLKQPAMFGEGRVAADVLERKIQELAAQRQATGGTAAAELAFPTIPASVPVQLTVAPWVDLSDAFTRPVAGNDLPELMRRYDWSSGHLWAGISDDLFLLTNRKSIVAVDVASGKTRWNWMLGNCALPGPVRPLVHGEKLYIRSATMPGKYGVACLDRKTGRGLWQRDCEDNVISDPLLIHGRLYCLTFGRTWYELTNVALSLVELNPENGELLSRRRIAEAPTQVGMVFDGQAAWVANRLVVLFSGTTICLDLQGKIQWLRQNASLSPDADPTFLREQFEPPRELGGRLYVRRPGNCAVECLAPETGEVIWRRGVAGLQQILDLNANRVLVKTVYGPAVIDPSSGRVLWRREIPGMLAAVAGTTGGQILCAYQQIFIDKSQLSFLWLDAVTGQTKAHSTVPLTHREALTLGPIVVSGNRVWCCGGRGAEPNTTTAGTGLRISTLQPAGPAFSGDPL